MSTTAPETDLGLTNDLPDTPGLLSRMGAEVFATFVLVLLAGGAAVYSSINVIGTGTLGVALVAAAAIAACLLGRGAYGLKSSAPSRCAMSSRRCSTSFTKL